MQTTTLTSLLLIIKEIYNKFQTNKKKVLNIDREIKYLQNSLQTLDTVLMTTFKILKVKILSIFNK